MIRRVDILSRANAGLRALLFSGRINRAKEDVRQSPTSAVAHAVLGHAYRSADRWIPSIAEYRTSLCLQESSARVRSALGVAYYRQGLTDLAARELERLSADSGIPPAVKKAAVHRLSLVWEKSRQQWGRRLLYLGSSQPGTFRLEQLSPERYLRFHAISEVVDKIAMGDELRLIDVGGGDGLLALFLPAHAYCLVDPETNGLTGAELPYEADTFQVAVACHVLEHVSPGDRQSLIGELVRVASQRVLLLGPFRESSRDETLDRLFWEIMGVDWAADHLNHGLPKVEEVIQFLRSEGLPFEVRPIGCRGTVYWSVFAGHFAAQSRRHSDWQRVAEFFNEFYADVADSSFPNEYLIEIWSGRH